MLVCTTSDIVHVYNNNYHNSFVQVTKDTAQILEDHGYIVEERGEVQVKGKGTLITSFVLGKGTERI